MDCPRYNGNSHPEEYVKEMITYCGFKQITDEPEILKFSKLMIDSTIKISQDIDSCEGLVNALKEHITFSIFKNSCKRKLHLLRYKVERDEGDTALFISNFRKLCRNAEINDIEKQKSSLYRTLPNDFFRNEFIKNYSTINSMNDLMICFENTLIEYSNFIRNGSAVAIKHVATGRYLSSWNKSYLTGSKSQMVFCGQSLQDSNAVWLIRSLDSAELLTYHSTVFLQHQNSNAYLDIHTKRDSKSPVSGLTEVSCGSNDNYSDYTWILEHDNSENGEYLKTRDVVILRNTFQDFTSNKHKEETLGSHDVTFTIDNDKLQEVFAHGGEHTENDKWCFELID
ncbi:6586_t:CDS:2 [Funneliformis caledonium]|uniref:6586_t:CDS:1 n=1 Tax=Funneliformis caledonium TaxID=1117310 RepID=A0A9N8YRF7_9GLOM|nr:6586_t:CDS:2 [Funneliformis caledonium]